MASLPASGGSIFFPPGSYRLDQTYIVTKNNIQFLGAGLYISNIVGSFSDGDIIQFGDNSREIKNVVISNLLIASSVKKTSGAALHLINFVRSRISEVIIDGQDGNGNLFDGVWFDKVDFVTFTHFQVMAQNNCLKVNGSLGNGPKADLFLSYAKVMGGATSATGLLIGGGFGGIVVSHMDLIALKTGVVIDQSLTREGNREIFFETGTMIDSLANSGVVIADSNNNMWIQFNNTWIASSANIGLDIQQNVQRANININGGTIFNNGSDGIRVSSPYAIVNVGGGTFIRYNRGYGINVTPTAGGNVNLNFSGATLLANSLGHQFITRAPVLSSFSSQLFADQAFIYDSSLNKDLSSNNILKNVRQIYMPVLNAQGTDTTMGGGLLVLGLGVNGILDSYAPPYDVAAQSFLGAAGILVRGFSKNNQTYDGSIDFWTKGANSTSSKMLISSTGNIGIGTSAPSYRLHVNGSVAGVGSYYALSDKRLKTDILPLNGSLKKIRLLEGVKYKWLNSKAFDDEVHLGFLAQDIESVFPEVVKTGNDGLKSIAYSGLIAPLLEATKELYLELLSFDNKISQLNARMEKLEEENNQLILQLNEKNKENESILLRLNLLEKKTKKTSQAEDVQ